MDPVDKAFFPLDKYWGLDRSGYSPDLSRDMVWLSGLLPYEHAVAVMARIGGKTIPKTSLWEQSQRHGERLRQHVVAQRPKTAMSGDLPWVDHGQRKGVSMDGGMVHIRQEGWKEFKVGATFDLTACIEPDPVSGDLTPMARAANMHYCAVLGSVDEFAPALWHQAWQDAVVQAAESVVVADGAEWIWNLVADFFPDSVQVVDWYHATQHLNKAAQTLFPADAAQAQRWYQDHRLPLYQGHCWQIAQQLEAADCASVATYFQTHRRRMRYQFYREEGYPIGSGTVESGIKQFKSRLTGAGMRWSRPGAERMLVMRAAIMDHTFEALWADAA